MRVCAILDKDHRELLLIFQGLGDVVLESGVRCLSSIRFLWCDMAAYKQVWLVFGCSLL